jgi:hypothetical protein
MPVLKVISLDSNEAYQDMVRVPPRHRKPYERNMIIRVTAKGRRRYLLVRGMSGHKPEIKMDAITREYFGLDRDEEVNFDFTERPWDIFFWSWGNANPVVRIAFQLGVTSLILGLVSLVVAFK